MIFRRKVEDKVAERVATKVFDDFSKKKCCKPMKTSTIKDLINNPDDYELLARVESGEIVIRIRKQEKPKSNVVGAGPDGMIFRSEKPMFIAPDGNIYVKNEE